MSDHTFGDADPEDAWHPDDPVPVLLRNLVRRCRLLGTPAARAEVRDELDDEQLMEELGHCLVHIRLRLAMFAEDLEHIRNRRRAGG